MNEGRRVLTLRPSNLPTSASVLGTRPWRLLEKGNIESITLKAAENRLQEKKLYTGHRNLMGHFDLCYCLAEGVRIQCSQLAEGGNVLMKCLRNGELMEPGARVITKGP